LIGQRLAYWIFLGAIGFGAFFVLRPTVDFSARAPIQNSRTTIETKTADLAGQLGFSTDTLHFLTFHRHHLNYFRQLEDSLGEDLPSLSRLYEEDLFLSSWMVTIGGNLKDQDAFSINPDDLFNKVGNMILRFDKKGKVRRLITSSQNRNPTFVAGDSLPSIAEKIAGQIFSYDLSNYALVNINIKDTLVSASEQELENQPLALSESSVGNNTIFNWNKTDSDYEGPESISLEIKPVIREVTTDYGSQIQFGASVVSFRASDPGEPKALESIQGISNTNFIIFFITIGLLVGLVFFKGIQTINRGQVDWKRALFILVTITLVIAGWRFIFLLNTYDPFMSSGSMMVLTLNFLLLGVAVGLYAALAYIGWEAMAREEDQDQLRIMDAFWRVRFFFRETGDGLVRGFAFGGVLLGLFGLILLAFDTFYYQFDSQFGFTEASMNPKLLTINFNAWSNAWLVALGHVGITITFLKQKIRSRTLFYILTSILLGFLFSGSASLFAIESNIWYDILLFTLLAPVIIYVFEKAGLVTFSFGWWVFVSIILISPYLGSESLDVAYVGWVQLGILAFFLVYGFIAYRYGASISEIRGYIPEYQERMANQLRVEKEIEIARESQFKLMPLKPPSVPGVDVYGFFMPSFEVGGDYFDYVENTNGSADPDAITMTIVDVSGKAMKAAMHAVFTSGLLLSRLHKDHPASILREVTPTLYYRTDPQTFITCLIAQYNMNNRKLTIANAGHCLPIIKRNGNAEFVKTPDPKFPLGLKNQVDYQSLETDLEPGDFVLFYSDGLPEAVNPTGERFGYENLLDLVVSLDTDDNTSNEIALEIKRRVQKFSDYHLADDTTIICLKV